jgi:tellurite resistance protein TerC
LTFTPTAYRESETLAGQNYWLLATDYWLLFCYLLRMDFSIWAWAGFGLFILLMLALDLGVLNRRAHTVTYREAAVWSAVWVTLAMLFAAWVFRSGGSLAGKEFLAGYLIELSLSVDNLFVFLLLFSYFKVPSKYQHRVLFWGVLGALVMRITMIGAGAALIERFHWVLYIFGGFLVVTGVRLARAAEERLERAERRVEELLGIDAQGKPIVREFEG